MMALVSAAPLLIIFSTGVLLSISPYWTWLQPKAPAQAEGVQLSFDHILVIAKSVPEAEIKSWSDVQQIDVRPSSGLVRVRAKNFWEVQMSGATGEILSSAPRKKTLLITIHDGSFFADWIKPAIFLPAGLCALVLWFSGMGIWLMPKLKRRLS